MSIPSKRKRALRWVLLWAQDCLCADCLAVMDPTSDPQGPAYPTLDHVQSKSRKGRDEIGNLLVKHGYCNHTKGNDHPSKRDMQMLEKVRARLAVSPGSAAQCESEVMAMFGRERLVA